jgi:hypothetical protein
MKIKLNSILVDHQDKTRKFHAEMSDFVNTFHGINLNFGP